jgi:hypothetical protein
MTGSVVQTAVDAIRQRIDLPTVIAEHTLITTDSDGFALAACPLHHDGDTGVIVARAASGVWHCAGCGNGGDVITFTQRTQNTTRRAAITRLYGRLIAPDPEGAHPMATTITDRLMRSTSTPHTARRTDDGWEVSYLPGRILTRSQATSAMLIAVRAGHGTGLHDHQNWQHINTWAAELGLTGPDAITKATDPPA